MRCRYLLLLSIGISWRESAEAQFPPPSQLAFYAEQRSEIWYPEGNRDEDLIRITRLPNRSFLAIHPLHEDADRLRHIGSEFFYLNDTEKHVQYSGDTELAAAWPQFDLGPSIPGRDPMVDQYGDCSVLQDDGVRKVSAESIRHFAVWRIERSERNEVYTSWIAPALGCFALRSQVSVDGRVRERVDTVKLEILPADTRLSLPKGIRVISPRTYCDLYRQRHGRDYLPERLCTKYQRIYEEVFGRK